MSDSAGHGRTFWRDSRITNLVIFLVLILAVTVVGVAKIVDRSNHNSPIIESVAKTVTNSAESLHIIKDCTQPPKTPDPAHPSCFERSQAAGALAFVSLKDIQIVAVYCGRGQGDVSSIEACVNREFLKLHPEYSSTTTTVSGGKSGP